MFSHWSGWMGLAAMIVCVFAIIPGAAMMAVALKIKNVARAAGSPIRLSDIKPVIAWNDPEFRVVSVERHPCCDCEGREVPGTIVAYRLAGDKEFGTGEWCYFVTEDVHKILVREFEDAMAKREASQGGCQCLSKP